MIEYLTNLNNRTDPQIRIHFKLDYVNKIQKLKIMTKIEYLK